ncbi:eCIS core domain-containing protein [Aureivirga marina]|uniref:eCIS core domain-containing protein n=1 Tax=Aureivirga marina TaxID=1182451 RepID=UPI0018C9A3FD|nr:DUF4157 domain-containing protein [Aureivirga marina]
MKTQLKNKKESKNSINTISSTSTSDSTFQFKDNRPETVLQKKKQDLINSGTKNPFQFQQNSTNTSLLPIQKKANKTGLPDNLKSGIENLSGYSMDDVKVHYNSDKPAQLKAHAYAQGNQIHVASGQEKHLPHEAWHVVQQKQGRVQPTKQYKSIHINDDSSLEKEADVMGAKAMQFSGGNFDYSFLAASPNNNIAQLQGGNVALDALKKVGGDLTWDFIYKQLQKFEVTKTVQKIVRELCLYLVDQVVIPVSIKDYLNKIAPWIKIVNTAIEIVDSIPESVRTTILYVTGFGIRKFSTTCLKGAITESHIHTLLAGGSNFVRTLANIVQFMDKVIVSPSGALYKLYESGALGSTYNTVSSYLFGDEKKEESSTYTQDETSVDSEPTKKPMIDKNLGFFWITAENPELKKWKGVRDKEERAGMEMNARFGFKLFGNVMGTDNLKFRIPYDGDWETILHNITLTDKKIGINGGLTGQGIRLTKIRFNKQGLQFVGIEVDSIKFGNDIIDASTTTFYWSKGNDLLKLNTNATINIFSTSFQSKMGIGMTTGGQFTNGSLEVTKVGTINMFNNRLKIVNPQFSGTFIKGKTPNLNLTGDLQLKILDNLTIDSEKVSINYSEEGFVGSVALLRTVFDLSKDSKVVFEIHDGKVDKKGFEAGLIKLIYAYEPVSEEEQSDKEEPKPGKNTLEKSQITSLLPGFNLGWIKNTGLETLVISGTVSSVRIGSDGFAKKDVTKSLDKFSAKLFGVKASFDGEKGKGSIQGHKKISPPMPSLKLIYVPVPGIEVSLGIASFLDIDAGLEGSVAKMPKSKEDSNIVPWKLGGNVSITGSGGVEANVGAAVGSSFIASLGAELYGKAQADLSFLANLEGFILYNEDSYHIKRSDNPEHETKADYEVKAQLTSEVGARIKARAFYFFEKKLYEYKFKQWKLGEWKSTGVLYSSDSGDSKIKPKKTTFNGKDKPRLPIASYKEISAVELIENAATKGDKISDQRLLLRLVYDIADIGNGISEEKQSGFYTKIIQIAKKPDYVKQTIHEKLQFMQSRSKYNGTSSLIMTRAEWEKYSTTKGVFTMNKRKTIIPVDNAIEKYHKTSDLDKRLSVLEELEQAVQKYRKDSSSNSRISMVNKLQNEIEKEYEILNEIKKGQSETE